MDFCQAIPNKQGLLENNDIAIIEENKVITRERELAKTFNEHYINTVDKSSGIKPKVSPSLTKIRIFTKQLEKLSNPSKTILVYCNKKTSARLHLMYKKNQL